jgi:glycosyltransferase involved in cell wall biosynthesis
VKRVRLGVLASHPIQTQTPLYRELAKREWVDLEVLFLSRMGLEGYVDRDFGAEVKWDVPLLDGYQSEFVTAGGLAGELRRKRYDVLLVNGWAKAGYLTALLTAGWWGTRTMVRGDANGLADPGGWKGKVKRAVLGRLFGGCAAVVCIGTLNRAFYRRMGVPEGKLHLAPYSVDNGFFAGAAGRIDRRAVRKEWGFGEGETVFLFSGKLIGLKRPLDLVRALARMGGTGRLLVAGSGELEGEMRAEAERLGVGGRMVLAGFQNQTEICRCYAAADALVLPSESEQWGLVVNEAMCFGLPVVATTAVGAAVDLVVEGENGYTYRPGDVEALTERMERLAGDGELRRRMGERSRELIGEWGIEAGVRGVEAAVRGALGE